MTLARLRCVAKIVLALLALTAAETHYEILVVVSTASSTEIKRAYYKLAKSLHPDRVHANTAPASREWAQDRFKQVAAAYAVLSDAEQRRAYDASLTQKRKQKPQPPRPKPQQQPKQPGQAVEAEGPYARARRRLHEVDSAGHLLELTGTSEDGVLERHLLLAYYDSRDSSCQARLLGEGGEGVGFPYPFAHQTQEWYGVWWEDILVAAAYDVAPALGSSLPPVATGGRRSALHHVRSRLEPLLVKRTGSAFLPACPLISLQKAGERLGEPLRLLEPLTAPPTEKLYQQWVWDHLRVEVRFRNELSKSVRVNWIHGATVNEMFTVPAHSAVSQKSFLSHTLQAELPSRKGQTISENSSLAVFRVLRAAETFVISAVSVDLDSTCEYWREQGECRRNPVFTATECPKSCGASPRGVAEQRRSYDANPHESPCADAESSCAGWVAAGECDANLAFMRERCRLSCGLCGAGARECADEVRDCGLWAKAGECASNREFMEGSCRRSCGFCGEAGTGAVGGTAAAEECVDKSKQCAKWAAAGQCEKNKVHMEESCAKACGSCRDGGRGAAAAATSCVDGKSECVAWAAAGQCGNNKHFMQEHCALSCGLCAAPCDDLAADCAKWVRDLQCEVNWRFMQVQCRRACGACGPDSAGACRDMGTACDDWARKGECESNRDFMVVECPRSCNRCTRPMPRTQPSTPRTLSMSVRAQSSQSRGSSRSCEDEIRNCAEILGNAPGACQAPLMRATCARTCGACTDEAKPRRPQPQPQPQPCTDTIPNCGEIVQKTPNACSSAKLMKSSCLRSCGFCGKDEL